MAHNETGHLPQDRLTPLLGTDASPSPRAQAPPHGLSRHMLTWPDSSPKQQRFQKLGGPSRTAPTSPHQHLDPERGRTPGTGMLPSAEGRGVAGSLFFTSCWVFGESLPLKTAGPVAAVCEGWSETGPEQRGSATEEVSSQDAL